MANNDVTKCRGCGVEFSDNDIIGMKNCPVCGKNFFETNKGNEKNGSKPENELREKSKNNIKNFIYAVVILIVLGAILSPDKGKRQSTSASNSSYVSKPDSCGSVSNSGWDGSVYQVERYLKRYLKDPSSFDAISWSKVISTGAGECQVRCTYRAKNSFGGYAVESRVFILSRNGEVLSVSD